MEAGAYLILPRLLDWLRKETVIDTQLSVIAYNLDETGMRYTWLMKYKDFVRLGRTDDKGYPEFPSGAHASKRQVAPCAIVLDGVTYRVALQDWDWLLDVVRAAAFLERYGCETFPITIPQGGVPREVLERATLHHYKPPPLPPWPILRSEILDDHPEIEEKVRRTRSKLRLKMKNACTICRK